MRNEATYSRSKPASSWRNIGGSVFLLVSVLGSLMAEPTSIPLWPKGAPGQKATAEPERDTTTQKEGLVAGRPLIRLGNVTEPSLTIYRPSPSKATRTAVVVFPGGGYHILAMDLEGTEVCDWLNSIGITAVLLKYRVPEPANLPRYAQPLQDAERAMSIVRSHASDWNVEPNRIGVLGFSAGGHLAALLSSSFEARSYPAVDEADRVNYHPDFAILVYPAYLSVEDKGEQLAPEFAVSARTSPTFIVQAEDDHTFVEGSLIYFRALERARVPAEMHLFPRGGHGFGLRPTDAPVTGWPALAAAWLRSAGFLPADPKHSS